MFSIHFVFFVSFPYTSVLHLYMTIINSVIYLIFILNLFTTFYILFFMTYVNTIML